MGRSGASSCFKIITCGSDSVDRDDIQATDRDDSSDRWGWSFRKKSARHQVLNNTVISGAPSLNKASSASATVSFQSQPNLTSPEKTSLIQLTDEKIELPAQVSSKLLDTITVREDNPAVKGSPEESIVIAIQAAIRGFLAQKLLLKHKNIIKLQAAVRGHIVRQHAVGTLRCVQAIIKMQILVRARRACQLVEGSLEKEKNNHGNDGHIPTLLGSRGEDKPVTYTSIEKILRNRFARQLLESTPRSKTINIKCEPSKSDVAWKWLERWMSVSSVSNEETHESGLAAEQQEKENRGCSVAQGEIVVPSESYSEPKNFMLDVGASSRTSENDDSLITYDAENLDLQANISTPPSLSHINEQSQSPSPSPSPSQSQSQSQNIDKSNSRYNISESLPIQTEESDLISEVENLSVPGKAETANEDMIAAKRFPPEQPETDVKKLTFSSRKASNPAFIAAQSKFEELSSATNSTKLTPLSNQHHGVEPKADKTFSATDQTVGSREMGLADNSVSHASVLQIGGSECGTELSISSTLDSPDRSEVGAIEFEQGQKFLDVIDHPEINENVGVETSIPANDLSHTKSDKPERLDSANHAEGESDNSFNAADSSQGKEKPDTDPIDVKLELKSEASHPVYKLSPEASPRSHTTISESHATPSSQTSVKTRKTRSAKGESNWKSTSSSVDKTSPSNRNLDSGARSSLEQLPKDHKTGKRRNSNGATKPDNVDQEPRDSGSSNSVPSYMQATESARAKAITSSSPRSSPDVQDKDIYIKKRHSLPGTNGRQGSPHIERSMSQTQQDRKWRR
ncbi:IQ-DOMAIN 32 [Olea europaea subsp. europaea]|uniref:IQ-DOMAIN 32 n=2 Tax=Olea europaea subsp. europaea TaxID=158383 RepID=A0A8S0UGB9_OLEEU|nr:IQ-DOMAIN 32 [Olea europaea subsp. europaea]